MSCAAIVLSSEWGYITTYTRTPCRPPPKKTIDNDTTTNNSRDYLGRTCGHSAYENLPAGTTTVINGLNVSNGDTLQEYFYYVDMLGNAVCLSDCPSYSNYSPQDSSEVVCKDGVDLSLPPATLILQSDCIYKYDTYKLLTWCVPKSITSLSMSMNANAIKESDDPSEVKNLTLSYDGINQMSEYAELFVEDMYTSRWVLIGSGIGGSCFFGFLFLLLLQVPFVINTFCWVAVFTVPVFFVGSGVACWWARDQWMDEGSKLDPPSKYADASYWQNQALDVSAYVLYALAGCWCLAVCFLRKRIVLAIRIAKVSARSILTMPVMVMYPFVQLVGWCIFAAFWVLAMFVLASTGDLVGMTSDIYGVEVSYSIYLYSDNAYWSFWYFLFAYFWVSEFTNAIGQITLSMG